ncbi:serine/threonine protein kinase [Labilithrix luteola]|uniref:non-specific serine/threonine protein kinase n=2 Tax=Labilithrix luteola TaxID=1391654 RepID=A0A0K1Q615_9BACT|nr:serine/threonine protein kinase [Labilithrix luteola]
MGSVYDVEDVTVGKRYVLKTLHPQLVSRVDLARRMEAEARTLAKLQHPNIVDVVTAGVTVDEAKMPFYVMERLNGQNLRVVLEKKSSLELVHCYRIATDVLEALEHAHENNVIHRDVKPENIFLHRNINGTTITKLLDFGIMRLLDGKSSHTHGKFIGTLRYASPEQIMGGTLGPATDIYSLGVVLYEMVCGRGPFDDVGDAYAIGAAHAQRPPPPLSRFAAVPEALERLVLSMLAKDGSQRPRDCFTVASELRRLRREEEAGPPRADTEVNVLSSVPVTRQASLESTAAGAARAALARTEASPVGYVVTPQSRHVFTPPMATGASGVGRTEMPSAVGDTFVDPSRAAPQVPPEFAATAWSSPPPAPFPIPSQPPPAQVTASVPPPAPLPQARPIDRNAPTRAGLVFGQTQRLAQNGTMMEDVAAPLPREVEVRAALVQRGALDTTLASASNELLGEGAAELRFPSTPPPTGTGGGTGPLAGEASTRPPERRGLVPIVAAAAVVLVVGGVGAVTVAKRAGLLARNATASASPSDSARVAVEKPKSSPEAAPVASAAVTATATALASAPAVASVEAAPVPKATGPKAQGGSRSIPVAAGRGAAPPTQAPVPTSPPATPPSPPAAKAESLPTPPKPAPKTPATGPGTGTGTGTPKPEDVGFD